MKRLAILTSALFLVFLCTFCGGKNNPYHSPKSVTKAFFESLYIGNFDEAKKYATPESEPIINFFQYAFPPEKFEGCDHITLEEITVNKTSDSTARCKCIVHFCNGRSDNGSADVVKRDGKWYVTLKDVK